MQIAFVATYLIVLAVDSARAWIVDFGNPIVHTQYGTIRGKIDERRTRFNRRPICSFLSIPFARPPVGANRFLVGKVSRRRRRSQLLRSAPQRAVWADAAAAAAAATSIIISLRSHVKTKID